VSLTDDLRRRHVDILAGVEELSRLLDDGRAVTAPPQAHPVLLRLAGTVAMHLSAQGKVLYPRLRDSTDPKVRLTAEQFAQDAARLAGTLGRLVDGCPNASVLSADVSFPGRAAAVLRALGARVQREQAVLYPLLDASSSAA
jgi:Hemerythrin HHE cation binding domain